MQFRRSVWAVPFIAMSLALLPGCPQGALAPKTTSATPSPESPESKADSSVATPRDYLFPPSGTSQYTYDMITSDSTSSMVLSVVSYSENKAVLRWQGPNGPFISVEVEPDGTLKVEGFGTASKRLPLAYFTSKDLVITEASGSIPAAKSSFLGEETLTLPAGTFPCLKVEESDPDHRMHYWYAKGVGFPVKMVGFNKDNTTAQFILRSFIKGSPAGDAGPLPQAIDAAFWRETFTPQVGTMASYAMMQGSSSQGDMLHEVTAISGDTYQYYKSNYSGGAAATASLDAHFLLESLLPPNAQLKVVARERLVVPFGVVDNCVKISVTKASESTPFLHLWAAKPYGVVKVSDGAQSFELSGFEATAAAQVTQFETSTVTTLAGSSGGRAVGTGSAAKFSSPVGLAVDGNGYVYVADLGNSLIRQVSPSGNALNWAGLNFGFTDGVGAEAKFTYPSAIALDPDGDLIVADTGNNRIRRIKPSRAVSTIAGGPAGFADGTTSSALLSAPTAVTVDSARNIYFCDMNNGRIRKIAPDGAVTTIAGSSGAGFSDGQGAAAKFDQMSGIAVDAGGNLYVADSKNHRIRKVTPTGLVTTFAGSGTVGFQDGPTGSARFNVPTALAIDAQGYLYVADTGNHRIRKISSAGNVTTMAGQLLSGSTDGSQGAATFFAPQGIAVDTNRNVYVSDTGNHRIRKISP